MFSHFLQSRIHELGLSEETVTFGADGLLTMVVARCKADPHMSIRAVTHEQVTMEELGGAMTHNEKSGVAHFAVEEDAECLALIRELLSFMPDNNLDDPPRKPAPPRSPIAAPCSSPSSGCCSWRSSGASTLPCSSTAPRSLSRSPTTRFAWRSAPWRSSAWPSR